MGQNKKAPALFKDELGGKIMTLFVGVRANTCAYLIDDGSEHKKANRIRKSTIKKDLMVKNYEDCLLNNKITTSIQK